VRLRMAASSKLANIRQVLTLTFIYFRRCDVGSGVRALRTWHPTRQPESLKPTVALARFSQPCVDSPRFRHRVAYHQAPTQSHSHIPLEPSCWHAHTSRRDGRLQLSRHHYNCGHRVSFLRLVLEQIRCAHYQPSFPCRILEQRWLKCMGSNWRVPLSLSTRIPS
jgi:hypothetical protein